MKTIMLKWFGLCLVTLPVSLYTAFVAQCFWNWFAVSTLHVSEIPFLGMLGLVWLIHLLVSHPSGADGNHWGLLASLLELCVPSEKRGELAALSSPFSVWTEELSPILGKLAENTVMLVLGLALHFLIS